MDEYKKYEPIFGSWYLGRLLGRGSFGKVFEITREEFGTTYRSALKIITVPQDEEDIKTRMSEGTDIETISEYYGGILKEIINENEIMSQLKGNSNIVSYEDHQIIPHDDGVGYDILIRMELLTPLLDRMIEDPLNEKEVVSLGIDMCRALELCHRKNIIHRDIKPQNIFISENGDYKLGDFGIARTMEKTTGGMSKKGTYKYMAPEVFRGEDYDLTVDIYSLGIVLYSLLNGNRGPFLPAPPAKVTHNDEEEARRRRFRGEPIPTPRDAGPMLGYIIQKACAADPSRRYQTAEQMRRDLESYLDNYGDPSKQIFGETDDERTELDSNIKGYTKVRDIPDKSFGMKMAVLLIAAAAVVLIAVGTFAAIRLMDSGTAVNLADMMTEPVVSGYDGLGVLDDGIAVDEAKKQDFLAGIKKEDQRNAVSELLDTVVYEANQTEGLSNGDTVVINAAYDSGAAEAAEIEIGGTSREFKVSGLKDFPAYLADADEFNGHYYRLVNEPMYWSDAKAACEKENGHLATITSQAEQDFIVSLIEEQGTKMNYWLGGTDAGHEGSWTWITDEAWTYSNWREKQPDNGSIGKERAQDYLSICMVSSADPGRYTKWWDNSDDGISKNYMDPPYYKDTQYYGYIAEWSGLD